MFYIDIYIPCKAQIITFSMLDSVRNHIMYMRKFLKRKKKTNSF